MKNFTENDLEQRANSVRLHADREDLIEDFPAWMKRGLQQTASGYGRKLNTGYKISFEGRKYRLYCHIFSNSGTTYFTTKKHGQIVVG